MDCRVFGHVVDNKPFLDGEYFYRFMIDVSSLKDDLGGSTLLNYESPTNIHSVLSKLQDPKYSFSPSDKTEEGVTYTNCFSGQDLVSWIVRFVEVDHRHAEKIAQEMLHENLLECIRGSGFAETNFYKFSSNA